LLLNLRHEELISNEITLRNEELEEIVARREIELSNVTQEYKARQEDNQILMEEEEQLLDSRDNLKLAADKVTFANTEIEREI
jgi:hypothetical protein